MHVQKCSTHNNAHVYTTHTSQHKKKQYPYGQIQYKFNFHNVLIGVYDYLSELAELGGSNFVLTDADILEISLIDVFGVADVVLYFTARKQMYVVEKCEKFGPNSRFIQRMNVNTLSPRLLPPRFPLTVFSLVLSLLFHSPSLYSICDCYLVQKSVNTKTNDITNGIIHAHICARTNQYTT